jgi:oligogalacturonide lyase
LCAVPAVFAQTGIPKKKPRTLPSAGEFVRLIDPATETTVVRLTAPTSAAVLPSPSNHFISTKDRFLIFSSDRSGAWAPYRLDLRTGLLQELAEGSRVDPKSLSMEATEKSVFLLDGGQLREIGLANKQERTLADGIVEFAVGATRNDLLVRRGDAIERLEGGRIADKVEQLQLVHPNGVGCVFSRRSDDLSRELWFASGGAHKLLARGEVSFPYWSANGNSVAFLRRSITRGVKTSQISEVDLQTGLEAPVSVRSQLACFAPNRSGAVFTGALDSKAQPNITVLLRSPAREMTICEHHAVRAADVTPVFAPDSRRIYFESDREGKSALYSVNVESLVDST